MAAADVSTWVVSMTHALTYWLLVNYLVIGGWYAWHGDWARVEYWTGALLIVHATTVMT
jgi:hypothetical protein